MTSTSTASAAARNLTWHSPIPKRGGIRLWPAALVGVGIAVSFIPMIGGGIAYFVDRAKNRMDANHELGLRAKYYAGQIAQVLNIDPSSVTEADLAKAAEINPGLAKIYNEVRDEQCNEDKNSLLANGAVMAAGFVPIPGSGAVAKMALEGSKIAKGAVAIGGMAKTMIAGLAGGAVAGALAREDMKAQDLIEAIDTALEDADAKGISRREALDPQLIFLIRLAQDEALCGEIAKSYGKKPHKMNLEEINRVMQNMPTLANAAVAEAHSVADRNMSVRDLAIQPPNLLAGHALRAANNNRPSGGSFVGREAARRAAAQMAAAQAADMQASASSKA